MKTMFPTSVILVVAMTIAGCSGQEPVDEAPSLPQPASPLTAQELDRVQALLKENICAECHGDNGKGSETGPTLEDAGENWTEEQLTKYIYNPDSYMVSHQEVQERNTGFRIHMPPYTDLSEEDRRLLARWVLQERE